MRTKALLCGAALLVAGVATSMAQSNVYSLNVVGYVNVVIPSAGKFACVANPLNTTNNTVGGIISLSTLPVGGKLLKWNFALGQFTIYTRVSFGNGWQPNTAPAVTLNPGEGFFLQSAPTNTLAITNTFVGEVLQGNLTNSYAAGLSLGGNLVPDSGNVTNVNLQTFPVTTPQSKILKWNVGTQQYDIFTRVGFGSGWQPAAPTITVAEGLFFNLTSPYNWGRTFAVQ